MRTAWNVSDPLLLAEANVAVAQGYFDNYCAGRGDGTRTYEELSWEGLQADIIAAQDKYDTLAAESPVVSASIVALLGEGETVEDAKMKVAEWFEDPSATVPERLPEVVLMVVYGQKPSSGGSRPIVSKSLVTTPRGMTPC